MMMDGHLVWWETLFDTLTRGSSLVSEIHLITEYPLMERAKVTHRRKKDILMSLWMIAAVPGLYQPVVCGQTLSYSRFAFAVASAAEVKKLGVVGTVSHTIRGDLGPRHQVTGHAADKVYYQNKVVVVTYHDISPNVYSRFVITPQTFSSHLDAFVKMHFHIITAQQFTDFLSHRGSVPANAVLLTFDDGYQNMYTYAFPILRAHHMQGMFFQIVASADKHDAGKLSWSEIKVMHQGGMAFGSHTYDSHYHVLQDDRPVAVFNTPIRLNGRIETPAKYHARVYKDFVQAREELSQVLGQPVTEFAWPYGHGTWTATAIAHEAGYDYLFTTAHGAVTRNTNPSFIKRVDVGKTDVNAEEAVRKVIDAGTFLPWLHYG